MKNNPGDVYEAHRTYSGVTENSSEPATCAKATLSS